MNLTLTDWIRRHRKLVTWMIAISVCYSVTYLLLSRISFVKAKAIGINAFYYVPVDPRQIAESRVLEDVHLAGIIIFYPLWLIDHSLGGPQVGGIPLTKLGKPLTAKVSDH